MPVTKQPDCLSELVAELRQTMPPIYLCDERIAWYEAVGQTLAAIKSPSKRWAAMILLASDLAASLPGISHEMAFGVVENAVMKAATVNR